jgi:hypothetical protein
MFVVEERHDEDLCIWRRHRQYAARYIGREPASEERSPSGAAPNWEAPAPGVNPRRARECECLPSPEPAEATQHHHQLRSICKLLHATGLGCLISQTWTSHRQDNLSVAGATMSSSTTHTEKGQEHDRLAPYHLLFILRSNWSDKLLRKPTIWYNLCSNL